MDEKRHIELLRAVVRNQGEIIQYLTQKEDEDDGPTFRTLAEKQADKTDDFDRL